MKFRDKVKQINPNIADIPRGYKKLGNFILLRYNKFLDTQLGEVVMEIYPWCEGVYQYITTSGESRVPELKYLSGSTNTEIIHTENNVKYSLDFSRVMFSGGNSYLRKRLVEEVNSSEFLVDMFAAVGNLSMQILFYNAVNAILIEQNIITYSYLVKTLQLNNIKNVRTINSDCREVDVVNIADRILMGYHEVDESHIKKAVSIGKSEFIVHLHPISQANNYEHWVKIYSQWFLENQAFPILLKKSKIKNYAPHLHHIELVFLIKKN